MTSFLKSFKNNFYCNREQQIKENLTYQLHESVKEIQSEYDEQNKETFSQTESTGNLCSILEAIFLHGLKDSFLWQTLSVISNKDVDRKPEPNFWPLLLIFLHTQTIEQIEKLPQIRTDIGNCRAWIRLSLNESLFSSYLKNIKKNSSALNPYYKTYAFLKDHELMDIANTVLENFEASVQINLHVNSTLLNQWTVLPLELSGLYTPPLRSCQITNGIDVASSLNELEQETIPIPKPLSTNEVFSNSISNSPFNQQPFSPVTVQNEKVHLQLLLENIKEINLNNEGKESVELNPTHNLQLEIGSETQPYNEEVFEDETYNLDKYSYTNTKVKDGQTNPMYETSQKIIRSNSLSSNSSIKLLVDKYNYDTLLIKHEKNLDCDDLDLNEVWQRFEHSLTLTGHTIEEIIKDVNAENQILSENNLEIDSEKNRNFLKADNIQDEMEDLNSFGFEILPKLNNEKFTRSELQNMVEYICQLARERGLDAQGYICKACAHPLGIDFASARVCSFSGYYYCEQCMASEQFVIPAKIIYNWDFQKCDVSKKAALFLTEFKDRAFIDLQTLNPKIYQASHEMATIQSLRIQLNFIRAYLYTCCESSIQSLKNQIKSKEYLYKHIHRYSVADLLMIPKGQLMRQLQKTYQFGQYHVLNCNLCSVKGFICEKCEAPKVLYPFHIKTTFRCERCSSVFHDNCLDSSIPCPKCTRIRLREDYPLLEAVNFL